MIGNAGLEEGAIDMVAAEGKGGELTGALVGVVEGAHGVGLVGGS